MPTKKSVHINREVLMLPKGPQKLPVGTITKKGVRKNINVSILYIASWLQRPGANRHSSFDGRRRNSRDFESQLSNGCRNRIEDGRKELT
jgi:malate synthase